MVSNASHRTVRISKIPRTTAKIFSKGISAGIRLSKMKKEPELFVNSLKPKGHPSK
jgi:hypothetical protein